MTQHFTTEDLTAELDRQARDLPDLAALRVELDRETSRRERTRKRTTLFAAAAAVAAIAVAATVIRNATTDGPGTAAPAAQLPAGSALVPFGMGEEVSPVSVTVPNNWRGRFWIQTPDALAVFFAPLPQDGPTGRSLGYVITKTSTVPWDESGEATQHPSRPVTVGARSATVYTSDPGTTLMGLPAQTLISWKLADGRWIHVAGEAEPAAGEGALLSWAETITEQPTPLAYTVQPQYTLPGYTRIFTMSGNLVSVDMPAVSFLCQSGFNPFTGEGTADRDCLVFSAVPLAAVSSLVPAGMSSPAVTTIAGQTVQPMSGPEMVERKGAYRVAGELAVTAQGTLSPQDVAFLAGTTRLDSGDITVTTGHFGLAEQVASESADAPGSPVSSAVASPVPGTDKPEPTLSAPQTAATDRPNSSVATSGASSAVASPAGTSGG